MKFCLAGLGLFMATVFLLAGCEKSKPPVVDQQVEKDANALREDVKQAVDAQLKKDP
jgi:hypothetical protein